MNLMDNINRKSTFESGKQKKMRKISPKIYITHSCHLKM